MLITELDDFMPQEAFELIEEFGTTVEYSRVEEKTYGTDNATYSGGESDFAEAKTAPPEGYSASQMTSGSGIEAADLKFIFAAVNPVFDGKQPTMNDKVRNAGRVMVIKDVQVHKSGELDCLYEVRAR